MRRQNKLQAKYMARDISRSTLLGKSLLALSALLLLCLGATATAQAPSVTFTQTNGLCGVGSGGCGDFSATGQHLAANSRGDLFIPASTSTSQFIEEIPATGGAPTVIFTGLTPAGAGRAVFADASDNLYYTYADSASATYAVDIVFIPFVNGSYPTSAYTGMGACDFPVPAAQTTACRVQLNYPASLNYYVKPSDVALDGSGNLYILSTYQGTCGTEPCYNMVLKWDTTNTFSTIAGTLPNNTGQPEFAVSKTGEVYYTDSSGNNYYYAAGSTTQASLSFPYVAGSIAGVSIDNGGNVYFTLDDGATSSSIIELPFVDGTACHGTGCVGDEYNLSYQLGGYTTNPNLGVAVSGYGKVFYLGSYPNSVNTLSIGNLAFGSTPVGTTSGTQTLLLTFGNPKDYEVFGSFNVTGPFTVASTTCANGTAYSPYATQSCTVTLTYSASAPGPQSGSLQAIDSYGNLIGTAALSGQGSGAALDVDPGTISAVGATWTAPSAIAVDAVGNTYVADSTTNTVYKTAAGGTTSTAIVTGLNKPTGVAVDGAGNVYVGNSGAGTVVEIPYSGTTYGSATTLYSGLSKTVGMAIDASGNLYVADSGNARVLLLSSSGNQPLGTLVSTVGSGFTTPAAVAIDAAGNLYISDAGTGKVLQLAIPTSTQTTVLSGLQTAAGVAVDASGSLFAADSGAGTIVRLPSVSGKLTPASEVKLGSIVATPNAVAVDSSGNVYAADTTDATVASMDRTLGLVQFGRVNLGLSSSGVSALVSNGGTAALAFNSPYDTVAGSTGSFSLQSSTTCANGLSLATGADCEIAALFSPLTVGALSETLAFSTTPATGATLELVGQGVELPTTTTTVALVSPQAPVYSQTVTVSAAVAQTVAGGPAPTGTVTFFLDGAPQPTVALTSLTVDTTISGLAAGPHSVAASYSGDENYASSTSAALTVTIGQAATTTTTSIDSSTVDANPTSQQPNTTVTFDAVVVPSQPGIPTGTVTFYNGTTALGAAVPVVAVTTTQNNVTTTTFTATFSISTLTAGTYNVTAVYSGDVNYAGSSSTPPLPLIISMPTITMTASSPTIVAGGAADTLTVTSIAGLGLAAVNGTTGAVDFSCSGLPQYATCVFTPAFVQVTPGVPATIALTVLINQPPVIVVPSSLGAIPNLRGHPWLGALLSILFLLPAGLTAWGLRRGQRTRFFAAGRAALIALFLLAGSTTLFSGCGSSNASFLTPKGTTTLTVNATITAVSVNPPPAQTLTLQLTVQ